MCTIGSAFFDFDNRKVQSIFKQCDVFSLDTEFLKPEVKKDANTGISYVPFTRVDGDKRPAWAGINEYGVCYVAVDSYIDENKADAFRYSGAVDSSVFDMYLKIISSYKNAKDAVKMAKAFYETQKYAELPTDILLISDAENMYFIETLDGRVRIIHRESGHFASTNHCRTFVEAIPYEQNHSTYLRLDRTEKILQGKPNVEGMGDVLRDSYYGKTSWSVCRYAYISDFDEASKSEVDKTIKEGLYFSRGAVIFNIKSGTTENEKPEIVCEYVINNNASVKNVGYVWKPFSESEPQNVEYIGKFSNIV
ncbi:MAG: hypothetical protein J1F11_09565 [Oscillospiraceae bacterium]|nr:hypothetical protein [Oscillospiraceae bacterium]